MKIILSVEFNDVKAIRFDPRLNSRCVSFKDAFRLQGRVELSGSHHRSSLSSASKEKEEMKSEYGERRRNRSLLLFIR